MRPTVEQSRTMDQWIVEWKDNRRMLKSTMLVNFMLDLEVPCGVKRAFVNRILDHFEVPGDLDYKSRMALFQLLDEDLA